jgi:hypothetical protein
MISLMVTFRIFSFLDFLADLLQKSISVASNLFACCVFSVHVSAPYSKILWTTVPCYSFSKPLKPNGNYMYHFFYKSLNMHFIVMGFVWFSL